MKYLIKIDGGTKAEIEKLAGEYFGVKDCSPLAAKVRTLLAPKFPKNSIGVHHVYNEPDLRVPMIRLLIVVDDEMDQGLLITRPKAAPANDHVAVAAPLARAA